MAEARRPTEVHRRRRLKIDSSGTKPLQNVQNARSRRPDPCERLPRHWHHPLGAWGHTRVDAVCPPCICAALRPFCGSWQGSSWCGVVSLEASIRSGNCSCCCCSAGWPAQRLELITAIKAVVLMVKEHTGSTTLTGWQRVAHAARHVCRPTSSLRRLAAGGCRTLPMDRQMMPAKWFCLVVSGIDVRSLGVWVRCGAGARG